MTTLIQYLQRVLIVAIPAVLVFLCFTPYRMKALSAMNLRTSRKHEAGLILFVTSIFGILALTLWPTYIWMDSPGVWGDIRILIDRPSWKSNLSLIPFTVFKDYIEDLFKTPVFFFATLINFLGIWRYLFLLAFSLRCCSAMLIGKDLPLLDLVCLH